MKAKGHHPLKEIIACKMFGIEGVPKDEQRRMVNRACNSAVTYVLELEALVEFAYEEGWKTGCEWGRNSDADISDDEWNENEDWLESDIRKKLKEAK